jgi:hypothetical protein
MTRTITEQLLRFVYPAHIEPLNQLWSQISDSGTLGCPVQALSIPSSSVPLISHTHAVFDNYDATTHGGRHDDNLEHYA